MKCSLLLGVMLSLMTFSSFARDEVGNGAGLYENRVALIWEKLPGYFEQTLEYAELDLEQKEIILELVGKWENLNKETEIKFENQDDRFFIDGEYRFAMTGSSINSPIIFNLEKLYQVELSDLNFSLISILVHELGHKIGLKNHFQLDILGNKVAMASVQSHQIFWLDFINRDEFIEVIKDFDANTSDIILYVKAGNIYNLEDMIVEQAACEGNFEGFNFFYNDQTGGFEGTIVFECSNEMIVKKVRSSQNSDLKNTNIEIEIF